MAEDQRPDPPPIGHHWTGRSLLCEWVDPDTGVRCNLEYGYHKATVDGRPSRPVGGGYAPRRPQFTLVTVASTDGVRHFPTIVVVGGDEYRVPICRTRSRTGWRDLSPDDIGSYYQFCAKCDRLVPRRLEFSDIRPLPPHGSV